MITSIGRGLSALGRGLRPVLPITLVTALAMYGQVGYALDNIAPREWTLPFALGLAAAIAVAVESIALYLQWHAHDSLLAGHTLTAARQRRVSYLIAALVGAVNYSHFSAGWAPTPAAVCFALFSAAGPWLWGLHTRRAQRRQLAREGQLDSMGAVFSAERFRWFPIRTILALRWSIDHGVSDPREAWVGFNLEHAAKRAERIARRSDRRGKAARPTPNSPAFEDTELDRRAARDEIARIFLAANPDVGARKLAAHLTEQGHPLSPSGAASAYLTSRNAS